MIFIKALNWNLKAQYFRYKGDKCKKKLFRIKLKIEQQFEAVLGYCEGL